MIKNISAPTLCGLGTHVLDDVFAHGGHVVVASLQLSGPHSRVVDADQERLMHPIGTL